MLVASWRPAGADERPQPAWGAAAAHTDGDADLAGVRTAFTDTLRRIERGNDAGPAADDDRVRAYPLYPYLEAARLTRALAAASESDTAADTASLQFLAVHGDDPVAGPVRRARLESLARRGDWARFLAESAPAATNDALRCLALQGRIALGRITGIAREIADVWLTGRQLPLECEPVFQWLRGEGLLGDDLVEQRVRLLLENGHAAFARVIAGRLPDERAAPWLRWAALLERPLATLDELLGAPAKLPDGALLSGWQRVTRDRPLDALDRFARLAETFDLGEAEHSRAALWLALGLAWDRRPEALDVFARVAPEHLDDYALGWLARAALWAGEWRLVRDAIVAMSASQRDETRWRYWAARAADETGDRRAARELYRSVMPTDNYYAAMAAARLELPMTPGSERNRADDARIAGIAMLAPFIRARELLAVRLPSQAAAEWRHGVAALDAEDGAQAIHLAMRWGWYDVAVATATAHRIFNDYPLLYPTPYDDEVGTAAALTRLDPALIYGVIRQESLYRPDAASAAGALGLTQLLPDTARRAARRWNQPEPGRADLLTAGVNVTLGAAQLRTLVDELGGQLPVALAGYNAGPNAARRWLPERPLAADVWIENIPFNETRDYVQRVLWHSLVFAWLDSGRARDTRGWLAPVAPPDAPRAAQ